MERRVVVLGCGPAGLAAASAAVSSGCEAIIISNTNKPSPILGCQYLHAPVPGYTDASRVHVSYRLVGTPEQYRSKVYGDAWQGTGRPAAFVGEHDACDISETYQRMWRDLFFTGRSGFISHDIRHGQISFIDKLNPDLIVSTIPVKALCEKLNHQFLGHIIYANGSAAPFFTGDNDIICDGTPERTWYRISNVFGYRTTEWATKPRSSADVKPVLKPLWTDCDCHPEVLRVGRYGAWEKKRLVHEVYPAVLAALKLDGTGGSSSASASGSRCLSRSVSS